MVYEALVDISKVRYWSIPGVHGIASVPACVLQVVACRLDINDSLRLSTKDVEHGLHGGGHV